ncbi:ArsR family transcriptional regulator [Paenibacillus motobuensis]
MSAPAISQHLKVLERAGLMRWLGQCVRYFNAHTTRLRDQQQ